MTTTHVFSVTFELTIHHWIRPLEDDERIALGFNRDRLWELRCSSQPQLITTEVRMQGDRPPNHMVEAEVRRIGEPSWLNEMHQKNGYQYSVNFIEVRPKNLGELIEPSEPS